MQFRQGLFALILPCCIIQGIVAQDNAANDLGNEEVVRPVKGQVLVKNMQIPVFPGVNEVRITTYADGRIHLMYNTSFKDMALADKHFAKLGKFYKNKNVFGINIPKLQKTPPYGYSYELCNAEINEQGDVASVKINIDLLGHGYGSYVFIDNFCQ